MTTLRFLALLGLSGIVLATSWSSLEIDHYNPEQTTEALSLAPATFFANKIKSEREINY